MDTKRKWASCTRGWILRGTSDGSTATGLAAPQARPGSARAPTTPTPGSKPHAPWPARVRVAVNRGLGHAACKPLVFALAALPMARLVWAAATNGLGANPVETLIRATGDWTLWMLCMTLAVTPLRQATGWHALARLRRMLGLFSASYAGVHVLAFAGLDLGFDLHALVADIAKRPFILVGATSLLLLIPLAATSWDRAVRTLGAARWKALHRTVYAIALLALLHFLWMRSSKGDVAEVGVYAAILATLYGWRLRDHLRTRPA